MQHPNELIPQSLFKIHQDHMVFDPLDELLRGKPSTGQIGNRMIRSDTRESAPDSQQRARVAKQRREKLTSTFDKLRDLMLPFGIESNAGRAKLLDSASEIIDQIIRDPGYHYNYQMRRANK
eukprot:NODE_129_length_16972_cov_2.172643.p15 type:complete len:122 gc:universal NODE_129_length_16972_cov_2.172643:5237-4872(-)